MLKQRLLWKRDKDILTALDLNICKQIVQASYLGATFPAQLLTQYKLWEILAPGVWRFQEK